MPTTLLTPPRGVRAARINRRPVAARVLLLSSRENYTHPDIQIGYPLIESDGVLDRLDVLCTLTYQRHHERMAYDARVWNPSHGLLAQPGYSTAYAEQLTASLDWTPRRALGSIVTLLDRADTAYREASRAWAARRSAAGHPPRDVNGCALWERVLGLRLAGVRVYVVRPDLAPARPREGAGSVALRH